MERFPEDWLEERLGTEESEPVGKIDEDLIGMMPVPVWIIPVKLEEEDGSNKRLDDPLDDTLPDALTEILADILAELLDATEGLPLPHVNTLEMLNNVRRSVG